MKNKIIAIIVAISATLTLTGCHGDLPKIKITFENPAPTVAAEPTPTVAATEPTKEEYEFGDIVWTLEAWSDGQMHLSRHAVVAHVDDVLIVTTAIGATAEDIRAGLPMAFESWADARFGDCIEQLRASECYATKDEAQAVADELNRGG